MGGGGGGAPFFKWLKLHNYWVEITIILYLGFPIGLISDFEKLGQCIPNKKYAQICLSRGILSQKISKTLCKSDICILLYNSI